MKIMFILNNYQMGAKLRMAPVHKLISQKRIDRYHTEVVFDSLTDWEIMHTEKIFAKKAKEV